MAKGKYKGTQDADDVVELAGTVLKIWRQASADGVINLADAQVALQGALELIPKVGRAFSGGRDALPQLMDADAEEAKAFVEKVAAVAGPGSEKWVSIAGDLVQIAFIGIGIVKKLKGDEEPEAEAQ
jgi:hypothetical protein